MISIKSCLRQQGTIHHHTHGTTSNTPVYYEQHSNHTMHLLTYPIHLGDFLDPYEWHSNGALHLCFSPNTMVKLVAHLLYTGVGVAQLV